MDIKIRNLLGAALLLAAGAANAVPMTYDFTGAITGTCSSGLITTCTAQAGPAVTGSFTLDLAVSNPVASFGTPGSGSSWNLSTSGLGVLNYTLSLAAVDNSVNYATGALSASGGGSSIQSFVPDQLNASESVSTSSSCGFGGCSSTGTQSSLVLSFQPSANALLPDGTLDVADFTFGTGDFGTGACSTSRCYSLTTEFSIASISSPTNVPEPGTLGLLGLGLAGAHYARRRRQT